MLGRLIDGKYPNVDAVIPKEQAIRTKVDRSMFVSQVKRIYSIIQGPTPTIELIPKDVILNLHAVDIDNNKEIKIKIDGETVGGEGFIGIGMNARFLHNVAVYLDSEKIYLCYTASNRAMTILEDKDATDNLTLIMPVMLNK